MITDLLIEAVSYYVFFVVDALPVFEVPEWMHTASTWTGIVFGYAGSMGVWFPWSLAGIVLATLLGLWLVSFGIKVARIVLSLFTAGGGSAA